MGILYKANNITNEISAEGLIPYKSATDTQFLIGDFSLSVPTNDTFTKLTPAQAKSVLTSNPTPKGAPQRRIYGKPTGSYMSTRLTGNNNLAYIGYDFLQPILPNYAIVITDNYATIPPKQSLTAGENTIININIYLQYSDNGTKWTTVNRLETCNAGDTAMTYARMTPGPANVSYTLSNGWQYAGTLVVIPTLTFIEGDLYNQCRLYNQFAKGRFVKQKEHRYWRLAFDCTYDGNQCLRNCSCGCVNFTEWGFY